MRVNLSKMLHFTIVVTLVFVLIVQIKDFLRFLINSTEYHQNPSATIFIGNKIDSVDARDREEVKKTTSYKLKQCFPSLKDTNIFFMSVTEVRKENIS